MAIQDSVQDFLEPQDARKERPTQAAGQDNAGFVTCEVLEDNVFEWTKVGTPKMSQKDSLQAAISVGQGGDRRGDRRGGHEKLGRTESLLSTMSQKIFEPWVPRRHLVTAYCLTAAGLMLMLRYNLSIAIVTMTDMKHYDHIFNVTAAENLTIEDLPMKDLRLDWDESLQGNVLGSYFVTYMIFNPIGGAMAERFGGRWTMFVGSVTPAILTFLSPIVVVWSMPAFIVLRMLTGALHAFVLAAAYSLISRWIPFHERTFALGFLQCGTFAGEFVSFLMTGYICENPSLGWPGAFYISGALAIFWGVGFLYFIYDSPDEHPRLGQRELAYLKQNKMAGLSRNKTSQGKVVKPPTQWLAIFKSRAMWASMIAKFSWGFGCYMLATKLPAYMNEVFEVPISLNGIYNASPYAVFAVFSLVSARLAEYFYNNQIMSLVNIRRVWETIAMIGPAVCILLIPFVGTSHQIVEVLIVLSQATAAFVCGGDGPNVADYAGPHFTGLLFGITNSMSGLDGLITPIIVGSVIEHFPATEGYNPWNYIFYLTCGIYLVGNLLFVLMVSSDLQEWAITDDMRERDGSIKSVKSHRAIETQISFHG